MRLPKKTLIISASILSLGLSLGAWAMSQKNEKLVFESTVNPILEARPEKNRSGFSSWERDLLTRQTATIPRKLVNYTDSTARDLLSQYLKEKQSNPILDEDAFVKSFLEQNQLENIQQEIEFTEYKMSDLKISSNNNQTSLKSYGNKVGEVSALNSKNDLTNELDVLTTAVSLNQESEFKKLDPIILYYKNLVSELLKIEVPSDAAVYHLAIINSFSKIAGSVENFKIFIEDPLRGIFVLSSYGRHALELKNTLKDLSNYFKSKEVFFNETEYGFLIERAANVKTEKN